MIRKAKPRISTPAPATPPGFSIRLRLRTSEEFTRFFDGLDLIGPGVVPINHWQPGSVLDTYSEPPLTAYAALARKPTPAR